MKKDKVITKSLLVIIIKVKIKIIRLKTYKDMNNYVFRNNNNLML